MRATSGWSCSTTSTWRRCTFVLQPSAKLMSRYREQLIAATVSLFKGWTRRGLCSECKKSHQRASDRALVRPPAIQWGWYLDELSGIDVVSGREEQLGKLRAIVDECEQRFQT